MRSKLVTAGLAIAVVFLLATNPVVADAAKQITGNGIQNNTVPGLPAGKYLASFHATFETAGLGEAVLCRFQAGGETYGLTYGSPEQSHEFASVAATTMLPNTSGLNLLCNSQEVPQTNWSVFRDVSSLVSFTKVDTLTAKVAAQT